MPRLFITGQCGSLELHVSVGLISFFEVYVQLALAHLTIALRLYKYSATEMMEMSM